MNCKASVIAASEMPLCQMCTSSQGLPANNNMLHVQGELHRWYENCEMRTIVLSDDSGSGSLDPLWFPGGNQLKRDGEQS